MFKLQERNIAAGAPVSTFAFRQDGFQILQPPGGLKFGDYPFKLWISEDNSPVYVTPTPTLGGADRSAEFTIGFSVNAGLFCDVSKLGIPLNKPFLIFSKFNEFYILQDNQPSIISTPGSYSVPISIDGQEMTQVDATNFLGSPKAYVDFKTDDLGNNALTYTNGLLLEIEHENIEDYDYSQAVPIQSVSIKSVKRVWEGIRGIDDDINSQYASLITPSSVSSINTIQKNTPYVSSAHWGRKSYKWFYICNFRYYGMNELGILNDFGNHDYVDYPAGETTWRFIPERTNSRPLTMVSNHIWSAIRGVKNV